MDSTGFYFGHPDEKSQVYPSSEYMKQMNFVAKVLERREEELVIEQRNKFSVGDTLYFLMPQGEPLPYRVEEIRQEDGTARESANHAREILRIPAPQAEVLPGCIVMRPI